MRTLYEEKKMKRNEKKNDVKEKKIYFGVQENDQGFVKVTLVLKIGVGNIQI